jgi:hypothetical protein
MGDTKMRRQVLAGIVAIGLFTVAPIYATVYDFSTDPNLATDWTEFDYYNYYSAPAGSTTATWNSTNQNLDLTSNMGAQIADRYRALYKTGVTRADTDGVTVTFSNYVGSKNDPNGYNTGVGLIISSVEQGTIVSNVPQYELLMSQEGGGYHYVVLKNGIAAVLASTTQVPDPPSTIKFEILRDGANYVFKVNDAELCRDSSITASLPYFCFDWAVAGTNTLSVSADNFGTIVPEPGTLLLLATGLLGLVCYAWRKRK